MNYSEYALSFLASCLLYVHLSVALERRCLYCVAQAGLTLTILLPQLPCCQGHKCAFPKSAVDGHF